MANTLFDSPSEVGSMLDCAMAGGPEGWQALFDRDRDRERLRRMVALRMVRRLQVRIDASDVIQDALWEL
jgi:hypothetical protein